MNVKKDQENKFYETQSLNLISSSESVFNGDLGGCTWRDENGNRIPKEKLNQYLEEKHERLLKESLRRYMPIGSVVGLKNTVGCYMVIGYKSIAEGTLMDYQAVRYPQGTTDNMPTYEFNHDDIEEIYHVGMSDNIQRAYKQKLLDEEKC